MIDHGLIERTAMKDGMRRLFRIIEQKASRLAQKDTRSVFEMAFEEFEGFKGWEDVQQRT